MAVKFIIFFIVGCYWSKSNGSEQPSIIIVGSGPAGIAAATKLIKNNFTRITVLEAENRIGGRINTVYFGDAFVDMGAQFCHGEEDNIVYSLVKDLGVLKHSLKNTNKFYYSNGQLVGEAIGNEIWEFAETLDGRNESKNDCENIKSIGECLDIKFPKFIQNKEQTITNSYNWIYSHIAAFDSPLDLNDLQIITSYKTCPGDLRMNWNGFGYKTILAVMMQKFPNPSKQLAINNKILLNSEVVGIKQWDSTKVLVETVDGGEFEADHVVFTPSVGVLKATYEDMFQPSLPQDKVEAVQNIGFGAIVKIQLHFVERWWKEDAKWVFIWSADDEEKLKDKKIEWLSTIAKLIQGENNPNVLTAWYAGKYVPSIEALSEQQVLEGHQWLLQKFFGQNFNVTQIDKILKSSWWSNPRFRGTYSYESVKGHLKGGSEFPEILGRPLEDKNGKPRVLFAGEATHPYYFSTVHGAIESGYREAQRIIQLYKNKIV